MYATGVVKLGVAAGTTPFPGTTGSSTEAHNPGLFGWH